MSTVPTGRASATAGTGTKVNTDSKVSTATKANAATKAATATAHAGSSDAPTYEAPVRGVRVKSRRQTRRMLSGLWVTQVATAIILPSVFAALGYRDWADIPGMILMLVGAGTIAILPYWFMAGRAILNKNEGWEVPSPAGSRAATSTGPGEAAANGATGTSTDANSR